jgi:hypothetical protein
MDDSGDLTLLFVSQGSAQSFGPQRGQARDAPRSRLCLSRADPLKGSSHHLRTPRRIARDSSTAQRIRRRPIRHVAVPLWEARHGQL